jgi:chromosome segregation ATPase
MGNFIQRVKSCFKPKQEEYASFINQDNLLLDNIQERVNQYDVRTYKIEENISSLKKGYSNLIGDMRKEFLDLKKECNDLNKELKTVAILNKSQEEKINELENKLLNMEGESIFLEDRESNYMEANSNYMDVREDLINS